MAAMRSALHLIAFPGQEEILQGARIQIDACSRTFSKADGVLYCRQRPIRTQHPRREGRHSAFVAPVTHKNHGLEHYRYLFDGFCMSIHKVHHHIGT